MMDKRADKIALLANTAIYDSEAMQKYVDGAPHIKHAILRKLYSKLVVAIYDSAYKYNSTPKILDLGAGEGSVTLPFLELGARVTAVDISESQLTSLKAKCAKYADNFETYCGNVFDAIRLAQQSGKQYDVIVANSFLHHIPDYLSLIRLSIGILSPYGQFFSFQDPLRYDSVGLFGMKFSTIAYLSWRVFRGDVIGGLKRRIRRNRGIYLDNCPQDNAEYHVMRGGVDQEAIYELFKQSGFECEILRYFSTQSFIWQFMGTTLGIKNTFAIVASKAEQYSSAVK